MTLRARVLLAAAYVLTVVVAGLEVPLAISIDHSETRQFQSSILTVTTLLAARINDDVPASGSNPAAAPQPPPAIAAIAEQSARDAGVAALRYVVTDRLGRVIADSDGLAPVGTNYMTPSRPEFASVMAVSGGTVAVDVRPSRALGQDLLVVAAPVVHNRRAIGVVRATVPLGELRGAVHRIWLGLAAIGALAVTVGLVAAWFLATSLADPVRRLERAAVRLGEGDLGTRAVPAGPREAVTLARSFNRMAEAVEGNMASQRDFVANASHQLRTPLTGLRLRLEAIRAGSGPAAEEAARAEAEVDRLAALVDDLLLLASATSARPTGRPVDLAEAAERARERWTRTAERRERGLEVRAGRPTETWADPADLDHLLDNLVENATRYSPPGATIVVEAGAVDGRPYLAVSDDGPGIAPAEQARVFERFFRGETGRRAGSGTGLGLPIAAELVRRWGGEIHLEPGPGARFVATFPPRSSREAAGAALTEPLPAPDRGLLG